MAEPEGQSRSASETPAAAVAAPESAGAVPPAGGTAPADAPPHASATDVEPAAGRSPAAPSSRGPSDVAGAIDAFLADLAIGKSPFTVTTYRAALRHFLAGLEEEARPRPPKGNKGKGRDAADEPPRVIPVSALSEEHPIDFARRLARDRPGMPRITLLTYTTAVIRFFAFLVREGYRSDLPLPRITERLKAVRGKRPRGLPRVPDDAVLDAILAAARKRPLGDEARQECIRLRDIAILECLRCSGMRVSELVGLRRGDLVRPQHSARVTGKGRKERLVYFTPDAWRSLEAYFAARQESAARAITLQPVFARHDRGAGRQLLPLTTKAVREIVQALAAAAQQEDAGVTPHRFRAWFATHMVEMTGDLAATQDLMGHESADTTRVYTRVAAARLRDLHRQAFET